MFEEAEQRWEAVVSLRPELEAAVAVQRRLVGRGLSLAEAVTKSMPATTRIQPAEMAIKLRAGTPALIGTAIEVAGETLTPFVLGFCDDLTAGEADSPASRLGRRLDNGEIDIGSLIAASLGRQQGAIRTKAHHVGVSPDLLWLVAELAAGPVAYRLQRELPLGQDETHALFGGWNHGFCPACGSWPAFANGMTGLSTTAPSGAPFAGWPGRRRHMDVSTVRRPARRSSSPHQTLTAPRDWKCASNAEVTSRASPSEHRRRSSCFPSPTSKRAPSISGRSSGDTVVLQCVTSRWQARRRVPL